MSHPQHIIDGLAKLLIAMHRGEKIKEAARRDSEAAGSVEPDVSLPAPKPRAKQVRKKSRPAED